MLNRLLKKPLALIPILLTVAEPHHDGEDAGMRVFHAKL